MTTITYEGAESIQVVATADVIEGDREVAWAERSVRVDPDIKWIVGRFVQADEPNENGHIFPLDDLKVSQPAIQHKPLNMLHRAHQIVGHYADSELIFPVKAGDEMAGEIPVTVHTETLAAFYKYYFPDLYRDVVEPAHKEGRLFQSMECVPETITCRGHGSSPGCGKTFGYAGRNSDSYCAELNMPRARRVLNKHRFTAGGLIVPPVLPGWKNADITQLAEYMAEQDAAAGELRTQLEQALPHLDAETWDYLMTAAMNLETAAVPAAERMALAKRGLALPDGSYPVDTVARLKAAIVLAQSKHGSWQAAMALIKKRAKQLHVENLLPDAWK